MASDLMNLYCAELSVGSFESQSRSIVLLRGHIGNDFALSRN